VVVELVEVDIELEVDEVLAEVELVELIEVEVLDVEVDLDVELVEEEVLEVLVELVDVELVEDDVELVDVLEVEVEVVTLSKGNNSPSANLYTLPTTPAENLPTFDLLIARIYGSTALDNNLGSPWLSL
jgi:hypothetical protein